MIDTKKKFNKRAFISLITMFLGIGVLLTGIMLLIMPDSTLAYWNKWSFLALEKNGWEDFHAVVSIYFTIIIVFHILENWKPMLSYMKSKAGENFKNKKELFSAAVVSILITVGSFTSSPISAVTEVFEPISESWYTKEYEPPFEDAQGLALNLLIKVQDLDELRVKESLNKLNLDYSLESTLEEIAETSDYSSRELYNLIK